ncbi:type II restriction endonuclease [Helicobacter heilmannii]|uniref:Type-2 restriction enzyme n=1 Tax=Helicobacter heilmannii TaxID=35817 RepID=A0A0K2Y933_HELHE|nr:type II restriction endonuclease [Helicobacter heilmannii]BDQ27227.1 type II restriction endonuclease MboI [Helicobacter heilmannii]CCM12172.1 Type II restriction enzyme MjaIII [Helicobacter heilmannii ASB1.4]CRI34199.1 Type II restriction enzyme MjaIII [Helicobacter heilmannii]
MTNPVPFTEFLATLQKTNRTLDFFVDWQKCLENQDKIRICCNHLNLLLGVRAEDLFAKVHLLFQEYPRAFQILPLLLAININDAKKQRAEMIVLTPTKEERYLSYYWESPQAICTFLQESGLLQILSAGHLHDLNDFVFGIEVGLDSNARKNRSGKWMEKHLESALKQAKLNFKAQVSVTEFKDLHASFGNDIKKFDFVIYGAQTTYFIECNFYSSGGSKLNEVARAYLELTPRFAKHPHKEFIWITDGQGWMDAKNKLQEAYKSVRVYNLSRLNSLLGELSHA